MNLCDAVWAIQFSNASFVAARERKSFCLLAMCEEFPLRASPVHQLKLGIEH